VDSVLFHYSLLAFRAFVSLNPSGHVDTTSERELLLPLLGSADASAHMHPPVTCYVFLLHIKNFMLTFTLYI